MSSKREAALELLRTLRNDPQAIKDGDEAVMTHLWHLARVVGGTRFATKTLQEATTPLEYIVERFVQDDALVCAAIPSLIGFEPADARENAMRIALDNGLPDSFERLMVECGVPAPPDALMIAFEGSGGYRSLRRLIACEACARGADIRHQDADGNNILHLICADIADVLVNNECDPMVVRALLALGADPQQRNADGQRPIDRMIAMPYAEPVPWGPFAIPPGFLQNVRAVQRLLMAPP